MTKKTVKITFLFAVLFLFIVTTGVAFAGSTEVLPKGVSAISITSKFYYPVDERFDPDGNVEDTAVDYNIELNSSVFPMLAPLDAALGTTAILGVSEVGFEYDFDITEINYSYGLTDRVSLGIKIPLWKASNKVDTNLDTISANVGRNPLYTTGSNPVTNPPLIPIAFGGVPLETQDILDLIDGGWDVDDDGTLDIPGFGFKEFGDWSKNGLGDIEVGARYLYHKSDDWRLAVTGKVILPTGWEDDPDNLVDYGNSAGTYGINIESSNDFVKNKKMTLNATFGYTFVPPDSTKKRIVADVNLPISGTTQKVDRDLGDSLSWEFSAGFKLGKGFGASLMYEGAVKFKDDYESIASALEEESDASKQQYKIGLSYSTIPAFMKKEFPIPMIVSLSYRDRFAGKNVFKSRYLEIGIGAYF